MKLFKYEPLHEGQCSSLNAIVTFGKKIESTNRHNGWYITLNLPFVKKHIPEYFDLRTFTTGPAHCFWRGQVAIRRLRGNGHYIFFHTHIWAPLEFLQDRQ